jgi:hypothetical protein
MLPRASRFRLVVEHDVAKAGASQIEPDRERRLSASDHGDVPFPDGQLAISRAHTGRSRD